MHLRNSFNQHNKVRRPGGSHRGEGRKKTFPLTWAPTAFGCRCHCPPNPVGEVGDHSAPETSRTCLSHSDSGGCDNGMLGLSERPSLQPGILQAWKVPISTWTSRGADSLKQNPPHRGCVVNKFAAHTATQVLEGLAAAAAFIRQFIEHVVPCNDSGSFAVQFPFANTWFQS